jgi:hypothetical protein
MEIMDIERIDGVFERCSTLIQSVEEKRKFINDELMDNYYHIGAWVYKNPDPLKALECGVWRLGVDNKGKAADIGMNTELMSFEGNSNSETGNSIANNFVNYMRCLTTEMSPEDLTGLYDQLTELVNEINGNMERYENEVKEKHSSTNTHLLKCSALRVNHLKTTHAHSCIKELQSKMKELVESAPAMMELLNPEKLLGQQEHIDKALKSNQTENLAIAFSVVSANHRRGKTLQAVEHEYANMLKVRNEALAKIAA